MTTRRTPLGRKLFLLVVIVILCIYGYVTLGTPKTAQALDRGTWAAGILYNVNDTVNYTYNGATYKYTCIQQHTSAVGWEPPNVPALWTQGAASTGATAVPTATRTNTPIGNPPSATPVGNYPYGGAAPSVPSSSLIQAENYDTAGSGVSYSDTTATNDGGQYRNDGVDIEVTTDTNGGYNVGWVNVNEYLVYTVNVTSTGPHAIDFRVASTNATGAFKLEDITSGTTLLTTGTVPNTGAWQAWATVKKTGISFASTGYRKLKITTTATGYNFNWFKIYTDVAPTNTAAPTASQVCNYPGWAPGTVYHNGNIVKYVANGNYYQARNEDANGPTGTDPTISTWYWVLYTCTGGAGPTLTPTAPVSGGAFDQLRFNQWFPNRNALYTYANFQSARGTYTTFANTGNATNDAIEIAAFFAHVAHETASLVYVDEQNYPVGWYEACGTYACPAGADHHGRGPLQLSWNYNYSMASDGMYYASPGGWVSRMTPAVGANILSNPNLVSTDGLITWKTALWYWVNHGKDWDPAKATPHDHIAPGNLGFGETTRDINGGLECGQGVGTNGYNQMQDRVTFYNRFLADLAVSDSRTKTC